MSEIDDGGAAFPQPVGITPDGNCFHSHYAGMTLRDWFAGQALTGWLSDGKTVGVTQDQRSAVARRCYMFADAMIAARKKEPKP